ncbi:ParA family protein [Marinospirillum sp.]|uniref:ParA family protein n=1 Tax=Marinospirillum sp. TaxID=2183934 RepID=UPI00384B4655
MLEQLTRPILAISNRKGGTGKTTTAVNLAAELAARQYRVLLVDTDSQGHCALGLGIRWRPGQPNLHDLFSDRPPSLQEVILKTATPGLDLVAANTRFEGLWGTEDTGILKRALEEAQDYDFILLDTPPSVDLVLINALTAASGVLIPAVPHHLGAEGVRQLTQLFYRVASRDNPGLKLLGIVPVMADPQVPGHREVVEELKKAFGPGRMLRGVRRDQRLAEAFAAGQPIRQYAGRSRGAMDYFMMTEQLLKI